MFGNFSEIIAKVNGDKRLIPDLMKAENGNNFRAISESAILDVIDPVLKEAGWYYSIEVLDQHLDIREAYGSKGKKLQFIATVKVRLKFWSESRLEAEQDGVGMGIDDNDKAMGKAYTYAVKYALLKLFRLRYGDDADFEVSKPLYLEKPKEEKKEEKPEKQEENKNRAKKTHGNEKKSEIPMSEKQRDYILGLMEKQNVTDEEMKSIYGYSPLHDEYIPMPNARDMIKWLEDGALPF